jgi:hypothetical protein
MDERLKKLEKRSADAKLSASATVDARFQKNITYKPVPLGAIATVEQGSSGLTGGNGTAPKSDDKGEAKKDDASTDEGKKKKKGFGLAKLMGSSGSEEKSQETTGSAAGRGLDKERLAKGGSNPAPVAVSVTAADINAFRKEGNLN